MKLLKSPMHAACSPYELHQPCFFLSKIRSLNLFSSSQVSREQSTYWSTSVSKYWILNCVNVSLLTHGITLEMAVNISSSSILIFLVCSRYVITPTAWSYTINSHTSSHLLYWIALALISCTKFTNNCFTYHDLLQCASAVGHVHRTMSYNYRQNDLSLMQTAVMGIRIQRSDWLIGVEGHCDWPARSAIVKQLLLSIVTRLLCQGCVAV